MDQTSKDKTINNNKSEDPSNGTQDTDKMDNAQNSTGAKQKVLPMTTNQKPTDVVKHQEEKLLSKHPQLAGKPTSKFLQKRMAKGQKMFFDSGDYNMSKPTDNRPSSKPVSSAPTRIAPDSSGEEEHQSEEDDDFNTDPAQQAIPTPDLLFLRRAARHMPMTSSAGSRRVTLQGLGDSPGEEDSGFLGDSNLIADGPVINPKVMARRRATLQVPSKLAD